MPLLLTGTRTWWKRVWWGHGQIGGRPAEEDGANGGRVDSKDTWQILWVRRSDASLCLSPTARNRVEGYFRPVRLHEQGGRIPVWYHNQLPRDRPLLVQGHPKTRERWQVRHQRERRPPPAKDPEVPGFRPGQLPGGLWTPHLQCQADHYGWVQGPCPNPSPIYDHQLFHVSHVIPVLVTDWKAQHSVLTEVSSSCLLCFRAGGWKASAGHFG